MLDLSKEIAKSLSNYTNEVTEKLEEVKIKVAKDTVKNLKSAGNFEDLTGDYRKGWSRKRVGTAEVIHNRTDYQLTHLLEKGHVKRGGGRTRVFPHIGQAEEKAIDDFVSEVEKVIKG